MQAFVNACLRVVALAGALALIVSQVIQNLEHLGWSNAASGIGLAAVAVPFAMAVAVIVMEHSWSEKRFAAAICAFLVLLCGLGHTFIVAFERTAMVRDQQAAARVDTRYDLARKALEDASARVTVLEAAESPPCKTVRKDGLPTRECVAARGQTAEARKRADALRSELAQIGAPVEAHGMAIRYGTLAELIDTWHPVLLPLAVEVGALVLLAFAFRRGKVEAPRPPPAASKPVAKEAEADGLARVLRDSDRDDVIRFQPPRRNDASEGRVIATFRPKKAA